MHIKNRLKTVTYMPLHNDDECFWSWSEWALITAAGAAVIGVTFAVLGFILMHTAAPKKAEVVWTQDRNGHLVAMKAKQ